jgi:hypothetical protein
LSGVEAVETRRISAGSLLPGPQALWILSRGLCRCRSFELPQLPRRKQIASLRLRLRHDSPYANTGVYAIASGSRAVVWYWDNAEVDRVAGERGLRSADLWVVPETLLQPHPAEGLRLTACADGVEAQRWSEGLIVASQWWPHAPTPSEWGLFARQLGAAGAAISRTEPPAVQKVGRQRAPWAGSVVSDERGSSRGDAEKAAYVLAGTALVVWACWLGGSWLKLEAERLRIDAEQERLVRDAAPVVAAREGALGDLRVIESLAAVARQPDPRLLLAALGDALPVEGLTVSEIDLRDGTLRARLAATSPNPPIAELVEKLNRSGWLANAKASTESGGRAVDVTAEVRQRAGAS